MIDISLKKLNKYTHLYPLLKAKNLQDLENQLFRRQYGFLQNGLFFKLGSLNS